MRWSVGLAGVRADMTASEDTVVPARIHVLTLFVQRTLQQTTVTRDHEIIDLVGLIGQGLVRRSIGRSWSQRRMAQQSQVGAAPNDAASLISCPGSPLILNEPDSNALDSLLAMWARYNEPTSCYGRIVLAAPGIYRITSSVSMPWFTASTIPAMADHARFLK